MRLAQNHEIFTGFHHGNLGTSAWKKTIDNTCIIVRTRRKESVISLSSLRSKSTECKASAIKGNLVRGKSWDWEKLLFGSTRGRIFDLVRVFVAKGRLPKFYPVRANCDESREKLDLGEIISKFLRSCTRFSRLGNTLYTHGHVRYA